MIAGPPGAGKTTLALIMAIRMGVPCLYYAADSDEVTMAARAASAVTGHEASAVREAQVNGFLNQEYGAVLKSLPIRFVFDPSEPSMEDVANGIAAYVDVFGEPPALIVIDNLMNMKHDEASGGNEWQGMRQTMKSLHWLARRTKANVWALHHTSEQNENPAAKTPPPKAPPRSWIQGKLAQLPEVILTVANEDGVFWMGVVKNRHGPSDPNARDPLRFAIDFARNKLMDPMLGGSSGRL